MDYLYHILVMVCLYVILATSFNLLIGSAGLFALSHAAFYAFGAYATAILTTRFGVPFPWPLLIGIVGAAGVGALVAVPAMRIGGHYLVIVTMALQVIVLAVLINGGHFTGGTDGIPGVPKITLFGTVLDTPLSFLPLAAILAAACVAVCWRIAGSPFGRALKAMRENEAATQAAGKNIVAMKVTVFALSAALASVAGALLAHYISFVGTDSFTLDETIYILAMVILGGTGNLWGAVLGAVILVILPELLKFLALPADIADKLRQIFYGLILIGILLLRPQGILAERSTAPAVPARRGGDADPEAVPDAVHGESPPDTGREGEVTVTGRGLAKSFGGIAAVRSFDIDLRRGVITGLIGPNGAGKTTAFNMLTGFIRPDSGSITFRGRSLAGLKPHEVVRAGVARSFQDLRLFTRMTVLENVLVALPDQSGDRIGAVFFRPGRVRHEERANRRRAMDVLRFVGLDAKAHERAEDLSYAEEKLLVIARLLASGAEVLLFDEPLSGLDPNTLEQIFPTIRRLARDGKTICIIEHNLDVIRGLCDTVVFLDEGRNLATGTPEQLISDPQLAERYFQ
jgi:branched-chain amino acid transport system permease protein